MKLGTYIRPDRLPYPFCPGCSHGPVLDRLDEALVRLQLDPRRVVVVTDIGCAGLSDQWFITHAFHGLHGRSVVYGEGLKLASPELEVIVLMGDGGAGIGLHHLLNAAKRNIGIHVIVFNNMNFGMTGGEHSITTPEGSITSTTAAGHLERPIKLCETLRVNDAPFVARRAYYDKDLTDIIEKAITFEGFSLVEVMEFCTAYYVPFNKFAKKNMEEILCSENLPRLTALDGARTEYTEGYRRYCKQFDSTNEAEPVALQKRHEHRLTGALDVVIAGSAGMKISSTAGTFARAAVLSGLHALQRDDYAVTVKTGHSVSFLKLSRERIGYLGVRTPDVLFILSKDGLKKSESYLTRMGKDQRVYVLDTLPEVETAAEVVRVDLGRVDGKIPQEGVALVVLSSYLRSERIFAVDALLEAAKMSRSGNIVEKQVHFVESGRPAIFDRASSGRRTGDVGGPRVPP